MNELALPLDDPNSLEEDMGVVLVDMSLTVRDGDSKKGPVWPAFSLLSMLRSTASSCGSCVLLASCVVWLSVLLTMLPFCLASNVHAPVGSGGLKKPNEVLG